MSKSNNSGNASNDDIAIMLREFRAGKEIDPISQSLYEKLIKNTDILVDNIKDTKNLTKAEMKSIKDFIITTLKDMGITVTNTLNTKMNLVITGLAKIAKDDKRSISLTDEVKNFSNLLSGAFIQSSKAEQRGTPKDALLKGISNEKAKEILQDLANRMGVSRKVAIDSATYKLTTFLGLRDKENEKKTKGYIDDLIDGLSKNKFIGGALRDTFRLVGLLGGQWLSQFGQLGKILGASFYIAMEAFGPVFSNLLLKGMGKLIGGLGGLIGKGAMALSLKAGGPLADLATAGTIGQKAVATGRMAGALGVATVAGAGAVYAGKQAGEDWKSGHKGRAVAFGAGGLALAGGALAAIIAGAFAPITLILVGIGGAIVGLTTLWKKYGDNIKKWVSDHGGFMKLVTDMLTLICPPFLIIKKSIEFIKDHWPWGKGKDNSNKDMSQQLGVPQSRADEKTNVKEATSFGKLKIAKDGAILNISDLSQAEASKQLQAYEKADPTAFGKVYEWAGSDVARLSSFQTDAAKLNAKGQATGALMYKGASQDLKDLRSKVYNNLISQGYSEERAQNLVNNLMYTSGRMTGSNTQHRGKGKWKSHDNVYGFGFDIGGGVTWSEKDYKAAEGAVKEFYRDKGLQVAYEGAGQGKSTGKHWDVKPIKNMRAKGAEELLKERSQEQKAQAEQHTIEAGEVFYNTLGKEELERVTREGIKKGKTQEEMGQLYEEELRKKGVRQESDKSWVQDIGSGKTRVLVDPHGNRTFENFSYMSKGANLGFE